VKVYVAIVISFVLSLLLSQLLLPRIASFAYAKGILDKPNSRKIHEGGVPRLGGLTFFPISVFVASMVLALGYVLVPAYVNRIIFYDDFLKDHAMRFVLWTASALIVYVTGVSDDLVGVRYRNKFVAQVAAGVLLCASGIWLKNLHGLFGLEEISPWLGWPLTIFAIVFITNAINFIDGLDGLASGVCGTALVYYAVVFSLLNRMGYTLMSLTVLGTLLPFMYQNVHGSVERRTKMFMGDTGSLFLGFLLATFGLVVNLAWSGQLGVNSFALAFAPVVLVCYDVLRVVLRRLKNHKSPFRPDRSHIHHKLLSLGYSGRGTLGMVLLLNAAFMAVVIVLAMWMNINVVLVLTLALWILYNSWISKRIKKNR